MTTPANHGTAIRRPEHPVDPLFPNRWSPRALRPDPIPEEDLRILFEAARWAPSSYNNQPWRLLYARQGAPLWPVFLDLLVPDNQAWAREAAVLVVFVSNTKFDHNGKPSPTHSFDCGAAWQSLALQASLKGYAAHGMQGFDAEKARRVLEVPQDFHLEMIAALGRQGAKESLPQPLQAKEEPSQRRPLRETVAEGKFTAALIHGK